jgi:hypothetical protein
MRDRRASVTAATILVVAAVTAASAAWAIASPQPTQPAGIETFGPGAGPAADRGAAGGREARRQAPDVAVRSSDLVAGSQQTRPQRLTISSLGIEAPVVPTGVTRAGNAQIPADGDVIGWYEYGSAPGDARGTTVLIGHRDTKAGGPGALFDLDQIAEGATISVRAGQRTIDYRVTALRSVQKAGLPSSLFRRGGPARLVVITCGGAFLPDAGGYQENLYAVALPRKG